MRGGGQGVEERGRDREVKTSIKSNNANTVGKEIQDLQEGVSAHHRFVNLSVPLFGEMSGWTAGVNTNRQILTPHGGGGAGSLSPCDSVAFKHVTRYTNTQTLDWLISHTWLNVTGMYAHTHTHMLNPLKDAACFHFQQEQGHYYKILSGCFSVHSFIFMLQ